MTPAGFAHRASAGRWYCAPHLALLNRKLLDVAAGRRRRLLVTMPPRHGKSEFISKYFPAWYLGTFPDRRVILASYEADFAMTWGRKVRDVLQEHGPAVFGVGVRKDSTAANRWSIEGRTGGMDTAGVGGPMTGKGADLLVIDDPVKNAEEAGSETMREKAWEWYVSTAYTRLEPGGSVVLIQTRWHEDDLAGRILQRTDEDEAFDVLNLPALAEPDDPLGREPGAPLWPARFDLDQLAGIRQTIGNYWFSALYQGRPVPREGGFFKRSWFPIVDDVPRSGLARLRFWDLAATVDGDYTVGVRMARDGAGIFYIEDVTRGRWTPFERDRVILQTAQLDGSAVPIWIEQEPGSSGLSVVQSLVRMLAGHVVHGERSTGDKQTRAGPLASQCEAGNVRLVRGDWNAALIAESCDFPSGKHDDQVDATSGAFNKLALPRSSPSVVGGRRDVASFVVR